MNRKPTLLEFQEIYNDAKTKEAGTCYPIVGSCDEAVDLARTKNAPVRCWERTEDQTALPTLTAVKAYPSGSYRYDRITARSKQPRRKNV